MILGGGVHTRVIPTLVHTLLAAASLYFNVVAFWREAKYMIENNMLMEEVDHLLSAYTTPPFGHPSSERRGSQP